eukprot:5816366-Alexandrium_andersonii.AAC.1
MRCCRRCRERDRNGRWHVVPLVRRRASSECQGSGNAGQEPAAHTETAVANTGGRRKHCG